MRTAFRLVREEHGPDAVILSNRRTEEGVEIVAASNYDEALVMRALDNARAEQKTAAAAVPEIRVAALATAASAPRAPSAADAMIAAMSERQPIRAVAGQRPARRVRGAGADRACGFARQRRHPRRNLRHLRPGRRAYDAGQAAAGRRQAGACTARSRHRIRPGRHPAGHRRAPAPLAIEVPAAPAIAAVPSLPAPQSDEHLAQLRRRTGADAADDRARNEPPHRRAPARLAGARPGPGVDGRLRLRRRPRPATSPCRSRRRPNCIAAAA